MPFADSLILSTETRQLRLLVNPVPVRGRSHIVSVMTQSKQETTGMRVMFWTWMILIVGGLAVMIVLPLLGR